jgi:arylsulfatase A-like enzyme
MRFLYVDIDTLRPDHLGCYGYRRPTSPTIDALAAEGTVFTNVYASDTPCLPSRTALSTGRFGIRTGVVNHGGVGTDPFPEGAARGFQTAAARDSWMSVLREVGYFTASISTFAERHSAYHFLAGFNEWHNLGSRGLETADLVAATARDWLARRGDRDNWFLHVHFWDPHTPYRTPSTFEDALSGPGTPAWLTEEVRAEHWGRPGPHSAQEVAGFGPRAVWDGWPRQPQQIADGDDVARMFDGYDTGIRFADHHLGTLLETLAGLGVLDETAVMVSSDHGENLGELGIYCDHQTADLCTTRLPVVLRWPGLQVSEAQCESLHYQVDVMATVLELLGGEIPESWDGRSFASARSSPVGGRDHLVLSHAAWTAQRAVRLEDWICIRSYFDAYHGFPAVQLFDVVADPHEQHDLADERPDVVARSLEVLGEWGADAMARSDAGVDPLWQVLNGDGPWHARVDLPWYLERLRSTGRGNWADVFEKTASPATARHDEAFLNPSIPAAN